MCRLVAYSGDEIALEELVISPPHSLLEQSHSATEAKLSVNGDGFGISWYGHGDEPGQYRDILPAWSDGNLTSLCRMIRSSLFLAHVRASTTGETSRMNCHPFTYGQWSFMHNGRIGGFSRIRRKLENLLTDDLYELRRGTTDSELLFLLLLANGLEDNIHDASRKVIQLLEGLKEESDPPDRLTCVFSDGKSLFAFRRSSDNRSPTLYVSKSSLNGSTTLASEALDANEDSWTAIPENSLVKITREGTCSMETLKAA